MVAPKRNDVIFYYAIIEAGCLDNLGVRIKGVRISEGLLYHVWQPPVSTTVEILSGYPSKRFTRNPHVCIILVIHANYKARLGFIYPHLSNSISEFNIPNIPAYKV